ncbi:hypothetical protein Pyn_37821 [Prunus yedoensis var. nudiflora]|uniref:Uncharacterized protein n=1 Tax=Prunus yedoensis var. nudiflora TaxID=2094558 RepID=A0A314URW4_PRUYE|nr:hypothetical protein Pyn_37821 [Prunus yedoensis var. nudiflora]
MHPAPNISYSSFSMFPQDSFNTLYINIIVCGSTHICKHNMPCKIVKPTCRYNSKGPPVSVVSYLDNISTSMREDIEAISFMLSCIGCRGGGLKINRAKKKQSISKTMQLKHFT